MKHTQLIYTLPDIVSLAGASEPDADLFSQAPDRMHEQP